MIRMPRLIRNITAVVAMVVLASCAAQSDLDKPPVPLGDFLLGYVVVETGNMQMVPISRSATGPEWEAALKSAIEARFRRYDGSKYYHISVVVDAYALAPPGIPLLLAPKSVLSLRVSIWDDAQKKILNEKPESFTVFEGLNGETMIGTGLTRTREKQMEALSYNAARQIQDWLVKHPEWFPSAQDAAMTDKAKTAPPRSPAAPPLASGN